MANRLEGDTYCSGNFSTSTMTLPANAVSDTNVTASAQILASKLQHGNHTSTLR